MGSRNNIHQNSTPHSYREDTDRKDQGRALLGEGSAPSTSDEDDPTVVGTMVPLVGKGEGTYKTLNK
jgi:hypothetical protein